MQKKLGFVRLALEMGIDILPMVGFGENQLFTTHAVGSSVRHWLFKNMGLGIPFITGRWGCTLLPHPTEVTVVNSGHPVGLLLEIPHTHSLSLSRAVGKTKQPHF